ncbi:histone-lysine N-methyltransferase PRDM9-like [Macrosteles quadrilineatus]|uniref:histone-lysine N-methyltransferase PRDM9-like n=1 Tax=Macrosteles quadrilineatus TaxID=74068 RepID=UPI0023E34CC6|nr:histone-lysine N-methyltransferase PRDM9-like [Macrosteles quadrilineatus]
MNFSPFGGHFPSSVPVSVHQFSPPKYTHETNSSMNGITTSTQNTSVMTEEPMVNSTSRYNHYEQHSIPVKYQRDSSTQIDNGMVTVSESSPVPHQNETIHYVYQEDIKQGQYQENMREIKSEQKTEHDQNSEYTIIQPGMPPTWQSIATPGSTVADYLSHLPASTLPISLHHFLKYSSPETTSNTSNKRDVETSMEPPLDQIGHNQLHQQEEESPLSPSKRKKKKKIVYKEKKPKPKPGEIRLTTALDGSTLYCCPECHMAYPDKGLLEQHLLGHTMERRFFCDICGAGLKRKDHLTRHKQSHNPDRPYVCTVCCKAFKRKEQLTLHFVIHSGEKRHVCPECGKGFYRKDHLRKHTRSHIARRVKAELNQHGGPAQGGS